MPRTTARPLAAHAAAALTAAILAAACGSDPTGVGGPSPTSARRPSFEVSIPGPGEVVVSGSPGAQFVAATPNKSLRLTTEFWDNPSSDEVDAPAALNCNSGFFAAGTISQNCKFEAAGSYANRPAADPFTRYFARPVDGQLRDAPSFTFNGSLSYTLKLEGSYTEASSEVGYFYRTDAGAYILTPITAIGTRQVGAEFLMTPDKTEGRNWGLYIRNGFNPQEGGCVGGSGGVGLSAHCSDATGSYQGIPYQQWALFLNAAGTRYLAGAEDNKLELLPNGSGHDSDYNDYLISVTPSAVSRGGAGCSPGFWKNARDYNWGLTGYGRATKFADVFGANENPFGALTLAQVLELEGGGINALGRQTVAALLNAATPDAQLSYELSTSQVIAKFQAAYPGPKDAYNALKAEFEALIDVNGRVCTLNNGGGKS